MCLCTQNDLLVGSFTSFRGALTSRTFTPATLNLDPVPIVLQTNIPQNVLTPQEIQDLAINSLDVTSSRMLAMLQLYEHADFQFAAFSLQGPLDLRGATPYHGAVLSKTVKKPYFLKTEESSIACVVSPTNIFGDVRQDYVRQTQSLRSQLTDNFNVSTAATLINITTLDVVLKPFGEKQVQPGLAQDVLTSFLTRGVTEEAQKKSYVWVICCILAILLLVSTLRLVSLQV